MDLALLPELHLSSPSEQIIEGEITLPPFASDRQPMALAFAQLLVDNLLPSRGWRISSIAFKWIASPEEGRIYGQAWFERVGTTVHFISAKLVDETGQSIGVATATAHLIPADSA